MFTRISPSRPNRLAIQVYSTRRYGAWRAWVYF